MAMRQGWAWGDVLGGHLGEVKAAEARKEEVGYVVSKGIWREADEEECWRVTGKPPVTVEWVD